MNSQRTPRKVLMLTQYLHMGGLERMVFNLSCALKSEGDWEPQVFVFDRIAEAQPENDLRPAFEAAGITVTVSLKRPGFSVSTVLDVRRKLAEENISVVHTHDLGALIYGVLAKILCSRRVRLIHTQHSFIHLTRRRIYKYYERFFVRFADEVVVVSADTRQTYVDLGISPGKLHVVPNGVRFPQVGTVNAADRLLKRKELVAALGTPAKSLLRPFLESRWILYMARLHRTKGQDHALELWARLSPLARGNSILLFVGPESETGRLKELRSGISSAPDSSRVVYAGSTDRPELWLACADLGLSCSEFEGMPLGPIEAGGAGLPLVLSEIPGHEIMKAWSSQYPLGDPAKGARMVEAMLEEIEADGSGFFKSAWEKGGEVRSRYALGHMSTAYSRLYATEGSAS